MFERLVGVVAHGQDVGQHLGGVPLVGEPVPHRHAAERGQGLDGVLGEASVLDAVEHPAEHPGGVFDRLADADVAAFGAEVGDVRPLVVGADLEGAAGAGRRLFEDEGDVAADHPLALGPGALLDPERVGQVDEGEELVLGEVDLLEEAPAVQRLARGRSCDCRAGHAGSRSIGQVMQRGPPRPRPSSLPPMSMTSMPCLRSMVLVATLRS